MILLTKENKMNLTQDNIRELAELQRRYIQSQIALIQILQNAVESQCRRFLELEIIDDLD